MKRLLHRRKSNRFITAYKLTGLQTVLVLTGLLVSHKPQLQLFEKVLYLYLWAWIGEDKGGKSALFNVKAKETEAFMNPVYQS